MLSMFLSFYFNLYRDEFEMYPETLLWNDVLFIKLVVLDFDLRKLCTVICSV